MLFEISKNLRNSSVTHVLLVEKQTSKKSKYINIDKTRISIIIAKIYLLNVNEIKYEVSLQGYWIDDTDHNTLSVCNLRSSSSLRLQTCEMFKTKIDQISAKIFVKEVKGRLLSEWPYLRPYQTSTMSIFAKAVNYFWNFTVNFTQFLRTPFFQNTSGRLFLSRLIPG